MWSVHIKVRVSYRRGALEIPPLEIENDDTDVIITSTATIGYAITKYNIIIRLSVLYLNLMFLVLKYVQNFMKIYKTL